MNPEKTPVKSKQHPRNPSLIRGRTAYFILTVTAFLVIIVMVVTVWKARSPKDSSQQVLKRVAALDPSVRKKVCAHHCNSVSKYHAARKLFPCIEIDIVLNPPAGGWAAVYHPPAINNHGLTLDYLLTNEGMPSGKLWLDVKDLSPKNWRPFLDLIAKLIHVERRMDTIVETSWSGPSVRQAVSAFRNSGFLMSYYLPTEASLACGSDNTVQCNALRNDVLQTLSMGFSHLSFDAQTYDFVQTIRDRFPPSVRLLTWDLTKSWSKLNLISEVDVYIVRFPSPFST